MDKKLLDKLTTIGPKIENVGDIIKNLNSSVSAKKNILKKKLSKINNIDERFYWLTDEEFMTIFGDYIQTKNTHTLFKNIFETLVNKNTQFLLTYIEIVLESLAKTAGDVNSSDYTDANSIILGIIFLIMKDIDDDIYKVSLRTKNFYNICYKYYLNKVTDNRAHISSEHADDCLVEMLLMTICDDYEYSKNNLDFNINRSTELVKSFINMIEKYDESYRKNKFISMLIKFYDIEIYFLPIYVLILEYYDSYIFSDEYDHTKYEFLIWINNLCYQLYEKCNIDDISDSNNYYNLKYLVEYCQKYNNIIKKLILLPFQKNILIHTLSIEIGKKMASNRKIVIYYKLLFHIIKNLSIVDNTFLTISAKIFTIIVHKIFSYENTIYKNKDFENFLLLNYSYQNNTNNLITHDTLKYFIEYTTQLTLDSDSFYLSAIVIKLYLKEFNYSLLKNIIKKNKYNYLEIFGLKTNNDKQIDQADIDRIIIISSVLIKGEISRDSKNESSYDNDILECLRIIYDNPKTSIQTFNKIYNLITELYYFFFDGLFVNKNTTVSAHFCKIVHSHFPERNDLVTDAYTFLKWKCKYYKCSYSKLRTFLYKFDYIRNEILDDILIKTNNDNQNNSYYINKNKSKSKSKSKSRKNQLGDHTCYICLNEPTHKLKTNCGHMVCRSCFEDWYLIRNKDPKCVACKEDLPI